MGTALDDEQFRRLAEYGEVEQAGKGRRLYSSGDVSYDFFLLRTATVEVVRDATVLEPERLVYRRGPGDFLGELSLLTGQHVYLTARVVTAGEVVRIEAQGLRRILAEQVDIADILIQAFQERRDIIRSAAGGALEIVGVPDSVETLALRRFVAQMLLPHSWLDAGSLTGHALIRSAGVTHDDLPVAVVNGAVLRRATPGTVAETLGLTYRSDAPDPDLVVVGAGPAGLAAAVYGASEGLVTLLLDGAGLGGQAAKSARIENYLGFPDGVSGEDLTRMAMIQALKFGVHIYAPCKVTDLDLSDSQRPTVVLEDGSRVPAGAVIAASGAHYRRLDIARWDEFERAGCIRYSATKLDVKGYESQPVAVVGGANSAGQAALSLAGRGSTVHLIIRGVDIGASMSAYLSDRILAHPRIEIHAGCTIRELDGDGTLSSVTIEGPHGRSERLDCRSLFCFIGAEPASDWLSRVERDEHGFVVTDHGPLPFQTSAARVFAVGDLRSGSIKRVATAVGEGASAVASVHSVLAKQAK